MPTATSAPCEQCGTPATPGTSCPRCGAWVFEADPLGDADAAPERPLAESAETTRSTSPDPSAVPLQAVATSVALRTPQAPRPVPGHGTDPLRQPKRGLLVAFGVLALLWALSWALQGDGPSGAEVHPMLRDEPRQTAPTRAPFEFEYLGHRYEVEPVADYELAGLVVSHNDPAGFGDIYHDDTSVDTRDLCVIWGANVVSGEYRDADFESGAWTCWVHYGQGVLFFGRQLSNNHLITNNEALRDLIEDVRVGDELRIKGMLVNYRSPTRRTGWRRSSTVRTDTGNGACEVLFVEELEFLSRGTPVWYALHSFSAWALVLLLLARVALFVHQSRVELRR